MRKVIYANDGKILTNGEIYGKVLYLADGVKETDFYEITQAEYEAILAEQDQESEEI